MRSVTSYFNPTLYKKNLARFWPLWALYLFCGLCMTAFLLVQQWVSYSGSTNQYTQLLELAQELPQMLPALVWIALFYCVMCAMAVYGYLYNHRSACGIHALPMRRDTLFLTNFLSGVSFFLIPNLIITIATVVVELCLFHSGDWSTTLPLVLLICAVLTGVEFFFFSFASFCAMVTGNILALPAFYCIFNGLVVGLYGLVAVWIEVIFYGVQYAYMLPTLVEWCTPVYKLLEACEFHRYGRLANGEWGLLAADQFYLHSPATVAAYAGVGLVFAVLALLVYRRRHIESAGDVIAFPRLFPLFRFGVGACAGLTGGTFMSAFFSLQDSAVFSTLFVLLWAVVGYFAAEMLLQKSFRVWKEWKGCTVLIAVCAVVCACAHGDVLGIERKVPQATEVESVSIYISPTYPDRLSWVELSDSEDISAVILAHQAVVDDLDFYRSSTWTDTNDEYVNFRLEYTMTDGSMLSRYYSSLPINQEDLRAPFSLASLLNAIVSDKEIQRLAFGFDALDRTMRVVSGELEYYNLGLDHWNNVSFEEDTPLLWNAIKLDFEEGTLCRTDLFNPEVDYDQVSVSMSAPVAITQEVTAEYPTDITLNLHFLPKVIPDGEDERSVGYSTFSCVLTPEARHTLEALELLGCTLPDWFFN